MKTNRAKKTVTRIDPESLKLSLLDSKGKVTKDISLDEKVFGGKISLALLHQAVNTYLANTRKGQACTKTKGEKRGGGRKPWRQKGTGRARVGSIRSPLWKGGGVTFGPKPRSYNKKFPERMKGLALKSAFVLKLKDKQVILIDKLEVKGPKTKDFSKILSTYKINDKKSCFVVKQLSENLKRASANLNKVILKRASDINALGILDCKSLVLTQESLETIEKRLRKWA